MGEYMTTKQTMDYLTIKSPQILKKWVDAGLPSIKVANSRRFIKSDIDKFMADHTVIKTKEAK